MEKYVTPELEVVYFDNDIRTGAEDETDFISAD